MKLNLILLTCLIAFSQISLAAEPQTLDDCFKAALKRSEIIGTQTELITQAEERYVQARGSILPSISGVASYLRQDTPKGIGTTIFPAEQPLIKLTGTQPLFRGLREFSGLRQAGKLSNAQSKAREQAAIQLYQDTAQAFYNVLALQKDVQDLTDELKYYNERIRDLNQRIHIGRSRVSERLTVEAASTSLRANLEQTKGQLQAAREILAFLTGLDRSVDLRDVETVTTAPLEKSEYLSKIDTRPDVQASMEQLNAADEGIWVAKGAHLPSVDLTGNYYLRRSGTLQDSKWDFQVTATLPIFSGGVTQSQVNVAQSQYRQAELALSQTKRLAEQQIGTYFDTFAADRSQLTALEEAAQISEKNFKEQTREYRLGLVTNLDVLQALTSYVESSRALDRARFTTKFDFARLESSIAKRGKY